MNIHVPKLGLGNEKKNGFSTDKTACKAVLPIRVYMPDKFRQTELPARKCRDYVSVPPISSV